MGQEFGPLHRSDGRKNVLELQGRGGPRDGVAVAALVPGRLKSSLDKDGTGVWTPPSIGRP
jgi:hypothetical protein